MLTLEQKGMLLDMIFEYVASGKIVDAEPIVKMAFTFIKSQLDRDNEKYQQVCERNRINGKLGGRPKKQMDNSKTQKNTKNPSGYLENLGEPKKPYNDNEDDNDKKYIYSHLEADKSEIRKLYPGNKNKSVADKKLPKLIEKYGKEQLIRCIERYNQYVQNTRADGFASLQYKNESTFWNGGYIDYLDENVSQETVSQSKEEVEYDNTRFTPEQLEAYYRTDPEDEDLPF